jgi:hypothetical protein
MPKHDLDLSEIDELDEIDGDQQLCLVWCDVHRCHEWHWLPMAKIGTSNHKFNRPTGRLNSPKINRRRYPK